MLDSDLADAYGTTTKALNQAVKRNRKRFPPEFMFQLNRGEKDEVVTNCDHLRKLKFSPNLPFAFTEYGAVMLASVLNSATAVQASIAVVRAFIHLRASRVTGAEASPAFILREESVHSVAQAVRTIHEKRSSMFPRILARRFLFVTGQTGKSGGEPLQAARLFTRARFDHFVLRPAVHYAVAVTAQTFCAHVVNEPSY